MAHCHGLTGAFFKGEAKLTPVSRGSFLQGRMRACFVRMCHDMLPIKGIYHFARRSLMETARLFRSGRSQAVRLPKAFRFEGAAVRIRRHGAAVILEPLETGWDWLDRISAPLDGDFIAAALEAPGEQARPDLDRFD